MNFSCLEFQVCGGGVQLAAWHIPSGSMINVMGAPTESAGNAPLFMDVKMAEGQILAGGFGSNKLQRFDYTHQHISTIELPKSIGVNCILTLKRPLEPTPLSLISGESRFIHVLTDFGFISSSIDLSCK